MSNWKGVQHEQWEQLQIVGGQIYQFFHLFLGDTFFKYVQRRNEDQPILLLFDGHKSHINVTVIEWARQYNIILCVLLAHTSHILHPLMLGVLVHFKKFITQGVTYLCVKIHQSIIQHHQI